MIPRCPPQMVIDCNFCVCLFVGLEDVFFHPQSIRTEEGHDVFLQCVSGDSSPPAQISWLKNGRVLTKGNQIQVATELKHFYSNYTVTDCYNMATIK